MCLHAALPCPAPKRGIKCPDKPCAGPTPCGDCGPEIAIDEEGQGAGQTGSVPTAGSGEASAAQAAALGPQQERQLSPIVQQLLSRLRANAEEAGQVPPARSSEDARANVAMACGAGSAVPPTEWLGTCNPKPTVSLSRPASAACQALTADHAHSSGSPAGQHPPATPGLAAFVASPPAQPHPATVALTDGGAGGVREAAVRSDCPAPDGSPAAGAARAGGSGATSATGFDWKRSAARMRLASAANRQAVTLGAEPAVAASAGAGCAAGVAHRPGTLAAGSRLLAPTSSSRGRTAICSSTSPSGRCATARSAAGRAEERGSGRAAAAAQRTHLAAAALIRGGGSKQ